MSFWCIKFYFPRCGVINRKMKYFLMNFINNKSRFYLHFDFSLPIASSFLTINQSHQRPLIIDLHSCCPVVPATTSACTICHQLLLCKYNNYIDWLIDWLVFNANFSSISAMSVAWANCILNIIITPFSDDEKQKQVPHCRMKSTSTTLSNEVNKYHTVEWSQQVPHSRMKSKIVKENRKKKQNQEWMTVHFSCLVQKLQAGLN